MLVSVFDGTHTQVLLVPHSIPFFPLTLSLSFELKSVLRLFVHVDGCDGVQSTITIKVSNLQQRITKEISSFVLFNMEGLQWYKSVTEYTQSYCNIGKFVQTLFTFSSILTK